MDDYAIGGSYYATALVLLGLCGLATAMSLGSVPILSRRGTGAAKAAGWSIETRLRSPAAPTGAYLQVFRL